MHTTYSNVEQNEMITLGNTHLYFLGFWIRDVPSICPSTRLP